MSNPARAHEVENSNARAADKLFGFRRWSRNLSAQRHKELERLNQIERRRQILELRTQNDLFNQMSAVNGSNEGESGKISQTVRDKNEAYDTKATSCSGQTTSQVVVVENNSDELRDLINQPEGGVGRARVVQQNERNKQAQVLHAQEALDKASNKLSNELRLTSPPPPPPSFPTSSPLPSPADALASDKGKDMIAGQPSTLSIRAHGSPTQEEPDKIRQSAGGVQAKRDTDRPAIVKQPITSDQLAGFVSSCVPKNKRVLCQIVRDKMSRLSKAKSYFYPTYYLFIQAIVDIDEATGGDQGLQLQQQRTIKGKDDLVGDSENIAVEGVLSADNSFSASSSISADMLFIGANGNGANLSSMKVLSGNSYSDNEVYADTETEEDNVAPGRTTKLTEQVRVKGKALLVKSVGSLQGRDSPLVFPNRDNNIYDTTDSGSLIDAWPTIKDAGRALAADSRTITANSTTGLCQASKMKDGFKVADRITKANVSCKGEPLKSKTDKPRLIKEQVVTQSAGELSIEDSNEDGDDMDDDDEEEDDDDDDSDHDESGRKRWINVVNSSRNCNNEEVNRNAVVTEGRVTIHATTNNNNHHHHSNNNNIIYYNNNDHESMQQDFFDNDRNPYTGTYGVLLAGRRRKKAKT